MTRMQHRPRHMTSEEVKKEKKHVAIGQSPQKEKRQRVVEIDLTKEEERASSSAPYHSEDIQLCAIPQGHMHAVSSHRIGKYLCPRCDYKANARSLIRKHISNKHIEEAEGISDDMIRKTYIKAKFTCTQCTKTFPTEKGKKQHQTKVHSSHNCHVCGQQFDKPRLHRIHMLTHRPECLEAMNFLPLPLPSSTSASLGCLEAVNFLPLPLLQHPPPIGVWKQ